MTHKLKAFLLLAVIAMGMLFAMQVAAYREHQAWRTGFMEGIRQKYRPHESEQGKN